jgi:hypothetical protein
MNGAFSNVKSAGPRMKMQVAKKIKSERKSRESLAAELTKLHLPGAKMRDSEAWAIDNRTLPWIANNAVASQSRRWPWFLLRLQRALGETVEVRWDKVGSIRNKKIQNFVKLQNYISNFDFKLLILNLRHGMKENHKYYT